MRKTYFNLLYYRNPPWDTQVSPPELLDYIDQHSPGKALDLGCGTGTNVITLAEHGWQVTGVDYAKKAIRAAEKKINQANVPADLVLEDVTKLDNISGIYDLVLDIGCYHSLGAAEQGRYVENLLRLTAVGSEYLLYGFFREINGRGPGMVESDLSRFMTSFKLLDRRDGTDANGRHSVWLTYQRKSKNRNDIGNGE